MSSTTTECHATLTDYMLVQMMADCGAKTIEGFTNDILVDLERREMKRVSEIYEKLLKMKQRRQTKHELNFWKVMQCLGEIGIEKLILVIKTNNLHSCPCHVYSNLFEAINLFAECLITVNVIKRVLYHRQSLVPIFFEALRQQKEPKLIGKVLIIMYRCLIVGKATVVEMYMQNKILKDIHVICQKQLDFNRTSLEIIEYGVKILYGLALHGDSKVRQSVKHSQAIVAVDEYKNGIERKLDERVIRLTEPEIIRYCQELHIKLDGGKPVCDEQSLRDILKEDCKSDSGHFIFCSAPACRKQFEEEKDHFRYCGACRLSRYCSKECQKQHWKVAHRDMCLSLDCFTETEK